MPTSVKYVVNYSSLVPNSQPYDLRHRNYLVPFEYSSHSQLIVTVNGDRTTEFSAYGNQLILDNQPPDNAEITISRNTDLYAEPTDVETLSRFNAGAPIKADDLNDNYSLLVARLEELENLVRSQAYLSDSPPDKELLWKGFTWINTNTWVEAVFNGEQFVEVSNQ